MFSKQIKVDAGSTYSELRQVRFQQYIGRRCYATSFRSRKSMRILEKCRQNGKSRIGCQCILSKIFSNYLLFPARRSCLPCSLPYSVCRVMLTASCLQFPECHLLLVIHAYCFLFAVSILDIRVPKEKELHVSKSLPRSSTLDIRVPKEKRVLSEQTLTSFTSSKNSHLTGEKSFPWATA